ncbi:MAG: efflux RND transporter periplasmic adaptor subunit [Acidobacteria bacterium]|nr:efflux RND transporter periplasmic adaptor subunit [Acidobacteriota bacterium]
MKWLFAFVMPVCALAQSLATVQVVAKPVERFVTLTAEILPYQSTSVVARVLGYIESLDVDRGSIVRKGQVIGKLSAPELSAQIAEAQAKSSAVLAQAGEVRARLVAAQSTAARLKKASETAGAIAANELVLADEAVRSAQAALESIQLSRNAAEAQVRALKDLEGFLTLTTPFDGVVSERLLHPGSLAGPSAGAIVRVEQVNRLRVVVAVPEANFNSVRVGQRVSFSVSGQPGETFAGAVSRVSRTLDARTRTMPVELDVANVAGKLAPGMYTEVKWPAKAGQVTLLVPATAVTSNTERSFVIRVENGLARYVNVRKGAAQGELVEVIGPLAAGERIIQRATDEIREGTRIPER